ncbi:MAG TPA: DNA methyltransferase [Candidatus Wunengus sp. YC60]|uniref:DNA methyltransferase n=1 Tax=Candidatus Wunengus sp. YC60 TaxID=3367697 RepID=UPI0040262878
MQHQLTLFDDPTVAPPTLKASRSGTFVDNMPLPIHRWFRYSAGFAARWVEEVLTEWDVKPGQLVLDPFVGSGTVPLVCDRMGISSIGVEAHPVVARICKAKLLWERDPDRVGHFAAKVVKCAKGRKPDISSYPQLIHRSFDTETLAVLDNLRSAWSLLRDSSPESELIWLALTSILRPTSRAGTAQWQYILPNKTKKKVIHPLIAFQQQIEIIRSDLRWMQSRATHSHAELIVGDARAFADPMPQSVDAVITSPPYANNYDYADALRFEMTFWGDSTGWGDIHDTVRKYLIVSSSQHSSRERLKASDLLESDAVEPIRNELGEVMEQLARVRETHGGKKHYHTMIGGYCRDISLVLRQLRIACKAGSRMCWVIGDSAPYGVYCPIEKWIAELAIAAGFKQHHFDKLRDRNIKWKNRKHRVPLKEGLLRIEG